MLKHPLLALCTTTATLTTTGLVATSEMTSPGVKPALFATHSTRTYPGDRPVSSVTRLVSSRAEPARSARDDRGFMAFGVRSILTGASRTSMPLLPLADFAVGTSQQASASDMALATRAALQNFEARERQIASGPTLHSVLDAAPRAYAETSGVWLQLRECESGNNYAANTGNGYYGAYQFLPSTWWSIGYAGLPSQASPQQQDAAAQALEARVGWGAWPVCSQILGLG